MSNEHVYSHSSIETCRQTTGENLNHTNGKPIVDCYFSNFDLIVFDSRT